MILESSQRTESMLVELQDMEQGENPAPNVSLVSGLDSSTSNHYSTPSCSPESAATQHAWMPEVKNCDLSCNQSPESMPRWEESVVNSSGETIYRCDACAFSTLDKLEYDTHAAGHVERKCPYCGYTSRAEGRLKRHIREFHSDIEPNATNPTDKETDEGKSGACADGQQGKRKRYKCRQCTSNFASKSDLWVHSLKHISVEKQLKCKECAFVTEYKHHLEYHVRNHTGTKPFKCSKCDYTCVNKSMLNSHMKSHSSFLPYQCSTCQYGTKYIHSLRLHIKKYNHGEPLHAKTDGTHKIYTRIDANGTRKGSKTRKSKEKSPPMVETSDIGNGLTVNTQDNIALTPSMYYPYPHQLCLPVVSQSANYNPVTINATKTMEQPDRTDDPVLSQPSTSYLQCNLCGYVCGSQEIYNNHVLTHVAKDNEDLFRVFGINADSFSTTDKQLSISNVSNNYQFYHFYMKNGCNSNHLEKFNISDPLPINGNVPLSPGRKSKSPIVDLVAEEEENSVSNNTGNSEPTPLDLSNGKSSPKEIIKVDAPQELSRNRRKGKAFKLERRYLEDNQVDEKEDQKPEEMSSFPTHKVNGVFADDTRILQLEPFHEVTKQQSYHCCPHCEMTFTDWVMHALHMRFHDNQEPFKCSACGKRCKDRRTFFMHIAEAAHG